MGPTLQRHPFSGLVDSAGIVHHLSGPNTCAHAPPPRRGGRDGPVVRPRRTGEASGSHLGRRLRRPSPSLRHGGFPVPEPVAAHRRGGNAPGGARSPAGGRSPADPTPGPARPPPRPPRRPPPPGDGGTSGEGRREATRLREDPGPARRGPLPASHRPRAGPRSEGLGPPTSGAGEWVFRRRRRRRAAAGGGGRRGRHRGEAGREHEPAVTGRTGRGRRRGRALAGAGREPQRGRSPGGERAAAGRRRGVPRVAAGARVPGARTRTRARPRARAARPDRARATWAGTWKGGGGRGARHAPRATAPTSATNHRTPHTPAAARGPQRCRPVARGGLTVHRSDRAQGGPPAGARRPTPQHIPPKRGRALPAPPPQLAHPHGRPPPRDPAQSSGRRPATGPRQTSPGPAAAGGDGARRAAPHDGEPPPRHAAQPATRDRRTRTVRSAAGGGRKAAVAGATGEGSPTETLLRLLLPLDSQVRPSSQRSARAVGRPRRGRSEGLTKPSNRHSDYHRKLIGQTFEWVVAATGGVRSARGYLESPKPPAPAPRPGPGGG
ncbi:unnamed protein product [Rangifer tarandus platyrhynchus]|uniref:Uncharacterized protein n=1 Tax=Rangifer tarandus platyrhynchus TaxID=3082113 RepID=A0ACB1KEI6_RANTA